MVFIGENLKRIRETHNLTLRELAAELEAHYGYVVVDYSSLARWETNAKACPRRNKLILVADYLGVDVNDFFGEPEEADQIELDDSEILEITTKLLSLYKRNPSDPRLHQVKNIIK